MSRHSREEGQPEPLKQRRKRVVLSDSRRPITVVRPLTEVKEQTSVGELLVRDLVHIQFKTALLLAALVMIPLGALPLLFFFFPTVDNVVVVGVRLPWLLLGVLPFLLLFVVGYWYNRLAERHERDFVTTVEN